jgi:molybdate transport system substrate-binding protein
MLKKWALLFPAILLLLFPAACANQGEQPASQQSAAQPDSGNGNGAGQAELLVSAAASLTDALHELKASFEQEHAGITITYVFGSSGKLAQQIEQGAPSDVFLSASQTDMDKLAGKNLIAKESRVDFAKNELVLITSKNSPAKVNSFADIPVDSIQHLAIGEPESVPVGRYSKEVFEHLKLWDKLQSKLVLGSDVRQVLTYVESGNAELGVVYASDAAAAKNSQVLATAKPEWHAPIVYPGAIVASSAHPKQAKAFLDYLTSETGKEILKKYGFQ